MIALVVLIVLSLCFSLAALTVFFWAQRDGQFDAISADSGGGAGQGAELPLIEEHEWVSAPSASIDRQPHVGRHFFKPDVDDPARKKGELS